jgi:hypothetical protein
VPQLDIDLEQLGERLERFLGCDPLLGDAAFSSGRKCEVGGGKPRLGLPLMERTGSNR